MNGEYKLSQNARSFISLIAIFSGFRKFLLSVWTINILFAFSFALSLSRCNNKNICVHRFVLFAKSPQKVSAVKSEKLLQSFSRNFAVLTAESFDAGKAKANRTNAKLSMIT